MLADFVDLRSGESLSYSSDKGTRNEFRVRGLCDEVGFLESGKIPGACKDGQVGVAAKLGCAVKYACLTAHEQRLYSMHLDRRKDFEYRVAYQANRQDRNKLATTFPIHATALAVRDDAMKPIPRRRFLQA